MRSIAGSSLVVGLIGLLLIAGAKGVGATTPERADHASLDELARLAVSENTAVAERAIQQLRNAGQSGLDALFIAHPKIFQRARTHARCEQPETKRWRRAVDAVARQRDAAFSRLYWHTDLEQARAIAAESGKLVLSLRLLGNLDDELSCANSRYFRTVLYADPSVADDLREHFVLHWESVRPVPRITIDMGDGRRIERTITGNSVHYVLDSAGRVVDVLPGLWDAASFRQVMNEARQPPFTTTALGQAVGEGSSQRVVALAFDAVPRAISKSGAELSLLRQIADGDVDVPPAASPVRPATLSEPSRRLMWQKRFGSDADPNDSEQRRAMQAMFATFLQSLAADTALNRDELRPKARGWLADSRLALDVQRLNERVYAELFLTPLDDPWMGLVLEDAYVGLAGEGLIEP